MFPKQTLWGASPASLRLYLPIRVFWLLSSNTKPEFLPCQNLLRESYRSPSLWCTCKSQGCSGSCQLAEGPSGTAGTPQTPLLSVHWETGARSHLPESRQMKTLSSSGRLPQMGYAGGRLWSQTVAVMTGKDFEAVLRGYAWLQENSMDLCIANIAVAWC